MSSDRSCDREVAARGLLAQRLEHDGVEVAAQLAGEPGATVAPSPRPTTVLGSGGTLSQTARTIPSSESVCTAYGRRPVSSS